MNLPARTRILPSLTSLKLLTGCPDDYYSKDKAIPLFFFLCLASSDRSRFSGVFKKKKSYAEGNEGTDTSFQTIFTLI